jgi:asparagine synthase (glutamine-hydrolysing)
MCGIAGWYGSSIGPEARAFVEAAVEAQRHRGPDHTAIAEVSAERASALFGHNRLSIIDLSDAANQPMWDAEKRVCIVYNGEIYNYLEVRGELQALGHEFVTQSDTEVILEAFKRWGADSFGRLNGMFAFALFDQTDGALWLVRDRFGVKPLYLATRDGALAFASTPGPIARSLGCLPNLEYVARGMHYWLYEDDAEISQYESVRAVPPGHYVVARPGKDGSFRTEVCRWYDFADRVAERREAIATSSEAGLLDELTSLLESAVTLRLRSDVPVGISLSGGLDSSGIAAMVSAQHGDVTGFSLGHPDHRHSEGPLVAAVARKTGISVRYAWPTAAEGSSAFWEALAAQDAPFPGLSIVGQYLVFKDAHRAGMKVLLGGQGSDEVLMGYRKFQLMLLQDAVRARHAGEVLRYATSAALMLAAEASRAPVYLRQRDRYLRRAGLQSALRLPEPAPLELGRRPHEEAWQRQLLDVTRLSLPTLLRYEDRNSMGNSLETRLPYLDYRFAELGVALPDALKVRGGYGKWILREAMRGRVPAAIRTARYKRGFDVPQAPWIAAGLGNEIRTRLRSQEPVIREYLGPTTIERAFSDARLGSHPTAIADATSLLWLAERT